ncbi:DUF6088 family protein [Desulfotignum phosphitoxidans]|jgi:hypothetical protein|uniref:S-adenosylhomocysteine hydrolase n=1 Tax=Desulfotignum phosphitoxidans DSM 13687 TaxID=1286635 RepID=S0FYX3_9BACT|nr:DUF6088 family protein [Desulfotignum phosphitoxidans]EMS77152.1 hypothetical protein Dpo_27c00040 [Desulfotignum phosphitoxidans DSM 13687]
MSVKKTLEAKIKYRIKRSSYSTFVLSDFYDLSDRDQILRALRKLIKKKLILRVGQGVYVRTKISSATKKIIPEQNIRDIAMTVLKKTGVGVVPTPYEQEYNDGKTTQVPTGIVIGVNRRVSKKIGFNGRFVKYEKVTTN